MNEEMGAPITTEAVVRENRYRSDDRRQACRPLWADAARGGIAAGALCRLAVSAGAVEQDLFQKLGDFFRSTCR